MRDYGDDVFRGTANYYAKYRPQYPSELFDDLVSYFGLDGRGNLLDLGCGTGELFVPLAQYFEHILAWDPDKDMIEMAKSKAHDSHLSNIVFERKSSKNLDTISVPLRLVTMGQSFHWMEQRLVLGQLYELIDEDGGIAIIGSEPIAQNPTSAKKNEAIQALLKKYLGEGRRAGSKIYTHPEERYETLLPNSKFRDFEQKDYVFSLSRHLDDIIGHLFSMSWSAKTLFGDRADQFEQEVHGALLSIEPTGIFEDKIKFSLYLVRK